MKRNVREALDLLELHHDSFYSAEPFATRTGHPVPMDTRGWSQVLVSTLTGLRGLERKKGADLEDGSDVKGANTWSAIDTPRFNGVIKAGTKAGTSDRIESLDDMPHLYFVLWDHSPRGNPRCRVWVVGTQRDVNFRQMCSAWYEKRSRNEIRSSNFQLHPPRGRDSDEFRNTCGNFNYPLLFAAEKVDGGPYALSAYAPEIVDSGECRNCSQS